MSDDIDEGADGRELLAAAADTLRVRRGSKAALEILGSTDVPEGEEALVVVAPMAAAAGKRKRRAPVAGPAVEVVQAVEKAKAAPAPRGGRRVFVDGRPSGRHAGGHARAEVHGGQRDSRDRSR